MTTAIIGATGNFGTDIVNALLTGGTDPGDILALGRDGDRLTRLADRGPRIASVDVTDKAAPQRPLSQASTPCS